MSSRLARAQITGQERLRALTVRAVGQVWVGLPAYRDDTLDQWLSGVLPIVAAAQRQSVALTEAYLARSLGRQPLGVDVNGLVGAAVRNGAPPETVYARPFQTVWTSLSNGADPPTAFNAGLERATSSAEMDVQLSQRATYQAVQDTDSGIYGYQRVADGGACAFCLTVDGAYVKNADAMALHNRCGCGLEPLTAPHPRAAFLPSGESVTEHYAVHEHGELGPVLTDPAHDFTSVRDLH